MNDFSKMKSKSLIYVIAGPSGSGKTTVVKKLMEKHKNLSYPLSLTSRDPKLSIEEDTYEYVSKEVFRKKLENDEFAEWVYTPNGDYFGVTRVQMDQPLREGKDLILDYMPEGYMNIRQYYPDNTVGIFITPPSIQILAERLKGRGTEDEELRDVRYHMALKDFNFVREFRYVLINDDLKATVEQASAILVAEKRRIDNIPDSVNGFLKVASPAHLHYYVDPFNLNKDK